MKLGKQLRTNEMEPELDLNKAMGNFHENPTLANAFNVLGHIHPDIPGQENAGVYSDEVNAFIKKEVNLLKVKYDVK